MKEYMGDLEKFILQAILNGGNNAYGVQIANELQTKLNKNYSLTAIYTTLTRLEKKGLLASKKSEIVHARGGKAKLFYRVTPIGQKSLSNSVMNLRRMGIV